MIPIDIMSDYFGKIVKRSDAGWTLRQMRFSLGLDTMDQRSKMPICWYHLPFPVSFEQMYVQTFFDILTGFEQNEQTIIKLIKQMTPAHLLRLIKFYTAENALHIFHDAIVKTKDHVLFEWTMMLYYMDKSLCEKFIGRIKQRVYIATRMSLQTFTEESQINEFTIFRFFYGKTPIYESLKFTTCPVCTIGLRDQSTWSSNKQIQIECCLSFVHEKCLPQLREMEHCPACTHILEFGKPEVLLGTVDQWKIALDVRIINAQGMTKHKANMRRYMARLDAIQI